MPKRKKRSHIHVILLHGLFKRHSHLGTMERAYKKAGFKVTNLDYPSKVSSIEELATHYLKPEIEASTAEEIILVGYSMGGLLVRAYLAGSEVDQRINKVLMIATPNKGTEIVDFVERVPLLRNIYAKLYGETARTLGLKAPLAEKWHLPEGIIYGVIAGNKASDLFLGKHMVEKPNDGVVSVESTKLHVGHQHTILPLSHSFMTKNHQVVKQALYFAKRGYFKKLKDTQDA